MNGRSEEILLNFPILTANNINTSTTLSPVAGARNPTLHWRFMIITHALVKRKCSSYMVLGKILS